MQQDFLLIRKMKNGDEAAMEVFVRRYYAQILQYCCYHCADKAWAEDLTQETFERFFRRLAEYKHQGKALNYLYTIARNLCIDWARKQREKALENPEEWGRASEESEKRGGTWEKKGVWDEAYRTEEKLLIEEALGKLPAELKEIVILHFFQEFSLRETAGILGIGLPLVKYRVKKAKERLRELLGDDREEETDWKH